MKPCDENIKRTIRLTREMIQLADQGDADREDTGCGVLYGVLRDSAYKLLQMAECKKGFLPDWHGVTACGGFECAGIQKRCS